MRRDLTLTVVGDSLLDRDIDGRAGRLAPDAPVPVLDELQQHDRPGGAALAAALAAAAGVRTRLVTAIARDDAGDTLRALIATYGVELVDLGLRGRTPEKIRVRAGGRPLVRMDRGGPPGRIAAPARASGACDGADGVLVSDYGRGLSRGRPLRREIAAATATCPVVWDPHPRGASPVPGCAMVTPNRAEARGFLRDTAAAAAEAGRHAAALRELWSAAAVLVTMGGDGAVLAEAGRLPVVVAARHAAGDSCGAGDALASALALALARGLPAARAAAIAVDEATAFVAAGGAGALGSRALAVRSSASAQELAERVRARGGRVVATGGCFDLLHTGHLSVLEAARRLGDCLIVCLNSDDSVRRLKGQARPLVSEDDRAAVLEALRCVDAVEVFEETTPDAVLRRIRPHVWVKGGDYGEGDLPERDVLAEWDGEVVIVPYRSGRSTTRLLGLARRSA